MMKPIRLIRLLLCCALTLCGSGMRASERWSEARARAWGEANSLLCGVNYIPADAVNYTAMWDRTSFSPRTIDRELALAEEVGLNCVRVVLQYAVYAENPKRFLKTFDRFLSICHAHGIKVMPVFFDDCVFGVNTDPQTGRQPEPLAGWYAWAWSPSPGHTMVIDERTHPLLEAYVKQVMTRFADDERILAWDLYNEPTNGGLGDRSLPLLRGVVRWAREVEVSQPVTIGVWCGNEGLNRFCIDNSDIVTFHCYADAGHTLNVCRDLKREGRPAICTEWMNRPAASTVADVLPVFAQEGVGCMLWGLVNGKTQTDLPWGHRPEHGTYDGAWQHDLFRGDFSPYDPQEIDLLKKHCKQPTETALP